MAAGGGTVAVVCGGGQPGQDARERQVNRGEDVEGRRHQPRVAAQPEPQPEVGDDGADRDQALQAPVGAQPGGVDRLGRGRALDGQAGQVAPATVARLRRVAHRD